ncbi:hypothetical protein CVT24_000744 [Panaeolus cyanescens]|uniref:SHSP domain-containing protein n=1 Tax=Panaeolus cyanescens TaxID=181874 RepID=A0A409YCQ4_9AGAR|nr:hypothetical protein CVT24_000744 [Panaeolus cyanescens]
MPGNNRNDDKVIPSPVTPAVTGIDYPTIDDNSTDYVPRRARGFFTHPNTAGSTIDDVEPPADARSLDQLWGSIRQEKEKKMAKEKPKVQSLEELTHELRAMEIAPMQRQGTSPDVTPPPVSAPKSPRRQKSIANFRESTDGREIVATFDIPNVSKDDIHISFQKGKLILTWDVIEESQHWQHGVRERSHKSYHRTLPLPEGTRFEEVHAQWSSRGLVLRYPNMRCLRKNGHSRSGES